MRNVIIHEPSTLAQFASGINFLSLAQVKNRGGTFHLLFGRTQFRFLDNQMKFKRCSSKIHAQLLCGLENSVRISLRFEVKSMSAKTKFGILVVCHFSGKSNAVHQKFMLNFSVAWKILAGFHFTFE